MKLEEVLPALRQGAMISCTDDEFWITFSPNGGDFTVYGPDGGPPGDYPQELPLKTLMGDTWQVVLPKRDPEHADTESRAPSTADRPVPGYGGFVIDIAQHAVVSMQDQNVGRVRYWLDDLSGPEIAQVDGRWLYVDPSMPKVNG